MPVINLLYNKQRYQPLALYFWTASTPMKAKDFRVFVESRFHEWDEMFESDKALPDDVKRPSQNLRAIRLRYEMDGDEVTPRVDHGGMTWQNDKEWFEFKKWGFVHNFGMFLRKKHLNLKHPWYMRLYGGRNNQTELQTMRHTLADHARTLKEVSYELHRRT